MKRLLGGIFESAHLLAIALLFGTAAILTRLSSPDMVPSDIGLSAESSAELFNQMSAIVGGPGRAVATVALIAAVLAPYIRNDRRMVTAWARIFLCAAALGVLIYGWDSEGRAGWKTGETASLIDGDVERHANAADAYRARGDSNVTPWNMLLALTGVNLMVVAFTVFRPSAPSKPPPKSK